MVLYQCREGTTYFFTMEEKTYFHKKMGAVSLLSLLFDNLLERFWSLLLWVTKTSRVAQDSTC